MIIIGYSVSSFTGKKDNLTHSALKVVFAYEKNDETHQGFYFVKDYNFIDKSQDFYKLIAKYYKEKTDLDLLFNSYGSVQEIRPKA